MSRILHLINMLFYCSLIHVIFLYCEFHQLQTQYFLQTVYIYTHKNYRIQFIKCVKSEETKTFENLMTDCLKI